MKRVLKAFSFKRLWSKLSNRPNNLNLGEFLEEEKALVDNEMKEIKNLKNLYTKMFEYYKESKYITCLYMYQNKKNIKKIGDDKPRFIKAKILNLAFLNRVMYEKEHLDKILVIRKFRNAKPLKFNSHYEIIYMLLLLIIYFGPNFMTSRKNLSEFNFEENLVQNDKKFKFKKDVKDRLTDVKGIDEIKNEIEEVVKMMKNPTKYEEAGAKLLKGILLIGKPGTGKTLLARALAGETNINFIAVSGSEFDLGIVGQASSRLKKLFKQAKQNAPCIIFFDEIDNLLHAGRRKGFERSVINTFLSEMDGFEKKDYVFVLGATNSANDLDEAALRPGRFDKLVYVPPPDKHGRKDIFDLYLKKVGMKIENISSADLAKMTPGFVGAEIENMINTTLISAVDDNKVLLKMEDFEEARDRIILGIKRKYNKDTLRTLLHKAIHEAGHTLVCYNNKICREGLYKSSIASRGMTKGATSIMPDNMSGTKEELLSITDMALAGFHAEELYFGKEKVGTGCGNDLSKATNVVKGMVKKYAMENKFGYMVVEDAGEVSHKISGETRNAMDFAIDTILKQRSEVVKMQLSEKIDTLKDLAKSLVEYEELSKEDIEAIFEGKPLKEDKLKKRTADIRSIIV